MKDNETQTKVRELLLAPPHQGIAPSVARINELLPQVVGLPLAPIPPVHWLPENPEEVETMAVPAGEEEYLTRNVDGNIELDVKRTDKGLSINPRFDRRSSDLKNIFILDTEGGDPLPPGVTRVTAEQFQKLWAAAMNPPDCLAISPFTANDETPVKGMIANCSLVTMSAQPYRYLRTTTIAPHGMVGSVHFYRSIFGWSDPWTNAAADLDFSGYEVCMVPAAHLCYMTKRELGLPYKTEDERFFSTESILVVRDTKRKLLVVVVAGSYLGLNKKMGGKMAAIFAAYASGASNIEHSGGGVYHVPGNDWVLRADASCTMSGGGKSDMAKIFEMLVYEDQVPYLEVAGRKAKARPGKLARVIQTFDDITATNVENGVKWGRDVEARHEQVNDQLVFNGAHFQRTDEWRTRDERTHLYTVDIENGIWVNFAPQDAEGIARYKETEPGKHAMLHPELRDQLELAPQKGRKYTIIPNMLRMVWNEKKKVWEPTPNPRALEFTSRVRENGGIEPRVLKAHGIESGQAVFQMDIAVHGTRAVPPTDLEPLCAWSLLHCFPNTGRHTINWLRHVIAPAKPTSPSIIGSGNEGPCTQGPFNCLSTIYAMWNALQTRLLVGMPTYWTASGNIGPNHKVGHRFRQMIMHVFANMHPSKLDPSYLLDHGYLEEIQDFPYNGEIIPASILGCRVNEKFVTDFIEPVFENVSDVISIDMLRPEEQDLDIYVRSIRSMVQAQAQQVEPYYENDRFLRHWPTVIQAALNLIKYGTHEGKGPDDPEVYGIFTKKALLASPEYEAGLDQRVSTEFAQLQLIREAAQGDLRKLSLVEAEIARITQPGYRKGLVGSLAALTLP